MINLLQTFRFKLLLTLILVPTFTFIIFFSLVYRPYSENIIANLQKIELQALKTSKHIVQNIFHNKKHLLRAAYYESLEHNFQEPSAILNTNKEFLFLRITDSKKNNIRYEKESPEFKSDYKYILDDFLYGQVKYLFFNEQKFLLIKYQDTNRQLSASGLFLINNSLQVTDFESPLYIISDNQILSINENNKIDDKIIDQIKSTITHTKEGSSHLAEHILHYTKIDESESYLFSLNPKSKYKKAHILDLKQIYFLFIGLFIFLIIIGIIFSRRLSSAFEILIEGSHEISHGNFDYIFPIYGKDEIAHLAQKFTDMAKRLSHYLESYQKKILLDKELQTAQFVQKSILPSSEGKNSDYSFSSFYRPATSIGGDWWNYEYSLEKTKFFLGDATGHGPSAALATSAAASTFSNLNTTNDLPIDLEKFNTSLHKTFKGQIYMTLIGVELKKNKVYYSSAAHESIILIKKDGTITAIQHNCPTPRIGDKINNSFLKDDFIWEQGDSIIIYSDGIFELEKSDGKFYSLTSFIRFLKKNLEKNKSAHVTRNIILKELIPKINKNNQPDDILFIVIENI